MLVLAIQMAFSLLLGGYAYFRNIKRLFIPALLIIASLGTLQFMGAPVLERWSTRLFASERVGVDPTSLTRQRQIESMIDGIERNFLLGNGLYGESSYWLERDLGGGDGIQTGNGFGHNQHISMIFVAGLLGGMPLLLWQFYIAIFSVFSLRKSSASDISERMFLHVLGCTIVLGTLAYGFYGGTFGNRGLTMWYGVATGICLAFSRITRRAPSEACRSHRLSNTIVSK
ncbi:hypothetical protein [Rhizobium sp. FKL33]|uniref:hypothetical protein n=1 Tax=Rhizobium sp. FKL33 TaxID=2562307 RepID=UPI0010C0B25E|nr:hypothetical protein [Rhizobium sp. FKL33]